MPLFEYECPICQTRREVWRPAEDRDNDLPSCVEDADRRCLGTPMFRVISAPAIRGETVSKS
jgi:putative FmdB family regulatory protein